MELVKWDMDKKGKKAKKIPKGMGFMLQVSKTEAYDIIKSLSTQLLDESPNSGRSEYWTKQGEYFSIAVED